MQRILDGGPAHLCGKIRTKDVIVAVDDKAIEERADYAVMSSGDAIKWWTKHFLGKPGTAVTVRLQRKAKPPFEVPLVRANVLQQDQQTRLEEQQRRVEAIEELDECHGKAQAQIRQGLAEMVRVGPSDQRRDGAEMKRLTGQVPSQWRGGGAQLQIWDEVAKAEQDLQDSMTRLAARTS